MLITKKAESLAWIIIWVFILSFVLLWIGSLIWNSKDLIWDFDKKMNLDLLTSSSYSIINNLDVSSLTDGQIFYLYKNTSANTFDIYSWVSNSQYKYVDKYWNKVDDPLNFSWDVYDRIFQVIKIDYNGEEKTVVEVVIKELNK